MSSSRIDAEHIAFEEAAKVLKEYRFLYKRARVLAVVFGLLDVVFLAVIVWMIVCCCF